MNKSMLSMVLGIIAIAIAFVAFPIVLDATSTVISHSGDVMESDSATTYVASFTEDDEAITGVGETTADIVLTYDLYEAGVGNVESITSTEGTDTPTADSYVEATKTLTVGGLTAEKTRTLTTTYKTESIKTTADIVLTYDLYEAGVGNVESITSTEGTDTPTADSYVEATKTLTVGGLIASATRTLTTTYETESMNIYTGLGSIIKVAPLIVFIGLLAGGGYGLFKGVQGMRGKRG